MRLGAAVLVETHPWRATCSSSCIAGARLRGIFSAHNLCSTVVYLSESTAEGRIVIYAKRSHKLRNERAAAIGLVPRPMRRSTIAPSLRACPCDPCAVIANAGAKGICDRVLLSTGYCLPLSRYHDALFTPMGYRPSLERPGIRHVPGLPSRV